MGRAGLVSVATPEQSWWFVIRVFLFCSGIHTGSGTPYSGEKLIHQDTDRSLPPSTEVQKNLHLLSTSLWSGTFAYKIIFKTHSILEMLLKYFKDKILKSADAHYPDLHVEQIV